MIGVSPDRSSHYMTTSADRARLRVLVDFLVWLLAPRAERRA